MEFQEFRRENIRAGMNLHERRKREPYPRKRKSHTKSAWYKCHLQTYFPSAIVAIPADVDKLLKEIAIALTRKVSVSPLREERGVEDA